jgi:hypothetical protein
MSEQHPITPPPNLVRQWIDEPQYMTEDQLGKRMYMISLNEVKFREIISKASQYGADQELEACCEWFSADVVSEVIDVVSELRAARRPQPPSLKERSLQLLETYNTSGVMLTADQVTTIRRALEQL